MAPAWTAVAPVSAAGFLQPGSSANIQAVSGASYTSDGYIRSLQSALDNAK
jgi:uncharacterized protein with FMN-binding domain